MRQRKLLRGACLAFFLLLGLAVEAGALSLFTEVEKFNNLDYVGNWVDMPGWYVKRHYHASGGAFAVTHHPARMYLKLDNPVPAGSYRLLLRVCLNRSANTRNLLKASLGNYDPAGRFTANAAAPFVQDFTGSGYGWYELAGVLKTGLPCQVIEIEAVTVENCGIGDDPEYQRPYAILDSLVITDEPVEIIKDTRRGRNELKFAGADPRQSAERIKYPSAPAAVAFENLPPAREPYFPARNLLRNSSFEFSVKPFYTGAGDTMTSGNNVDNDCLDAERPYHGRYSLKLVPRPQNLLEDYTGSKASIRYGMAFNVFYLNQFLATEFKKSVTGPLTLSWYLRTNGRPVSVNGKTVSHTDWQRYTVEYTPAASISFTTDDPQALVWVDALQLERGRQASDYQPLDGLEVGIQTGVPGNRFYRGRNLPLEISVSQAVGQRPERLGINYRILGPHLEVLVSGRQSVQSRPGGVVALPVKPAFDRLGNYLLLWEVEKRPELGYAIPFQVIEDPKQFAGSGPQLGAIISTNEEIMKIFKQAGFDWVNSLNDRMAYFDYIWPSREEMRFFDRYYRMWGEKYGIQYSFWRPHFNPPKFTENILGVEPAAHMDGPNIPYQDWAEFWERFTSRANYIKAWQPTDEQSYHRGPKESLPYVEIANRIIRKNVPGAVIMNSTQITHLLEMLNLNPKLDIGDAIGGSRHGFERNLFNYDRYAKDFTGKQYWVVGVGWTTGDWGSVLNPETFQPRRDYWSGRWLNGNRSVIYDVFNEAAVVGTERFGLYTAKFDGGRDPFALFAGDNTLRPWSANFINAVNFLRGHRPDGLILMETAYGLDAAGLYRKNGRFCVLLCPDGSYGNIEVNLDLPARQVALYDYQLNPVSFSPKLVLPVSKLLVIEDNGLGRDKLLAAIRSLKAYPVDLERRVVLPAGPGLELATFKMIKGRMEKVSGQPFPAGAGFSEPIDQGQYERNASWATVAGLVGAGTVKVDGRLDEAAWVKAAPSFIYCWSALDGSYGALQGIQNFSRIFELEDASVSFKSLWDGRDAYLAFEVLDGVRRPGDGLVVKLDRDLLDDLGNPLPDADDLSITVALAGGPQQPAVIDGQGREIGRCEAVVVDTDEGRRVELRLPSELIGTAGRQERALGLNVELVDQDGDGPAAVLSWTGNHLPRRSPFGYGQLILSGVAR
ncbi:MAG TPA: hypothetical protein PKN80_00870 [bacterium]|nr:hypothetical protein [bacterium]HNS49268.1 hypothetical protein [bacterium]